MGMTIDEAIRANNPLSIRLGSAVAFDKENPEKMMIQLTMGPMQFTLQINRNEFRQLFDQWNDALKKAPNIALMTERVFSELKD